MLLLKIELEERGDSADAPYYAWLIGTFFVGGAMAPSCAVASQPPSRRGAHEPDWLLNLALAPGAPVTLSSLSIVPLGAAGLVPAAVRRFYWRLVLPSPHSTEPPRVVVPARWLLGTVAALALYVCRARFLVAPPHAAIGPFLADCTAPERRSPVDSGSTVELGVRLSLFQLMYGSRSVRIGPRCSASATPSLRRGIVMAADGSQPKYAVACKLAIRAIRVAQRSELPIEVFHVGAAEAFSAADTSALGAMGGVTVADLLPRLAPPLRHAAALRLRSFAVKPFALLASSFEQVLLMDTNVLLFAPPEELFGMAGYHATGAQLFQDYTPSFSTLDPWLTTSYVSDGDAADAAAAYRRIARGADVDSSIVVLDKARAWDYLHVVAALNWWRAAFYRHTWGDKDTWALAAVALGRDAASSAGARVGWMVNLRERPPAAVWGHMQFCAAAADGTVGDRLLYLNWQPHYEAGYFELAPRGPAAEQLGCCVFLDEQWAGPHDRATLLPSRRARARYGPPVEATLNSTRDGLVRLGAGVLARPNPIAQPRLRRCAIYFGLFGWSVGCLVAAAARLVGAYRGRGAEKSLPEEGRAPLLACESL